MVLHNHLYIPYPQDSQIHWRWGLAKVKHQTKYFTKEEFVQQSDN